MRMTVKGCRCLVHQAVNVLEESGEIACCVGLDDSVLLTVFS